MSEKSHVSIEQHQCPVCLELHNTGAVLLDKRLRPSMEHNTVTGHSLCPEHKKLFDEGYIALVAAEAPGHKTHLKQEEAVRTGEIAHLRREVFKQMFNVEVPDNQEMVFVTPDVIEILKKMSPDA